MIQWESHMMKEGTMSSSSSAVRMTDGAIWKRILVFAIPIFWGNLFQQLYNAADSLIVGNFLGSDALAAVSSSGSLIHLMVGFFQGVFVGAGVIISRYYGAKDIPTVQKAVHTTAAIGLICGVGLTVIGVIVAPAILQLMGTPAEVMPNSVIYFRIYFAGSLGFILYNCLVGILQAVGDSKHPLFYLVISSIANIALDLLFIAVLGMGVGSAALATIISQFLSAFLCLLQLLRSPADFRLELKKIRIHKSLVSKILKNGIPSGIQNSIISIANVFVQTNINAFGALAVAGCGAYIKIQGFAFLPVICFTMAMSTFVSQNLGAHAYDRVKKGAYFGLCCCCLMAEGIGLLTHIFAVPLITLFSSDPQVITYGVEYCRCNGVFFFMLAFSHGMASIFRGAGRAIVPMFVMMIFWCGVRVSYIAIAVRQIPDIHVVFWAYPITWALSSIFFLFYFLKVDWMHGKNLAE